MKICIVCSGVLKQDDRILHRLAKLLAEGTGWDLREVPNLNADLNYFLPYLDMPKGFDKTPTAAWYTHRDTTISGKSSIWDRTAAEIDMRLTSARMYLEGLSHYGPTGYVTPPLDQEKFVPVKKRLSSRKPVVGVSGYCYRGGRKGEELIKKLLASSLAGRITIKAAGRGWPIPIRQYPWEDMQKFYQGLDVYLLPSSIEGVGYGVLEALACGVKVVIPAGVGIMDELPLVEGIFRYGPAGDYGAMEEALEVALGSKHYPDDLRGVVQKYTGEAWVKDHLEALPRGGSGAGISKKNPFMGSLAYSTVSVPPPPTGKMGLYVVAFGDPSRGCAVRCIESFKAHNPGIPVALCSDRPLGPEDILIKEPEVDVGARSQKIRIYELAPGDWEYVLYLDADTETVAPLTVLFDWLKDGWELVMCKNPGKYHLAANMGRSDNTGECQEIFNQWGTDQMMQWNGGVFAFHRCSNIKELFSIWDREWKRYGKRDQGALLRAFWENPVRAMWLGNEWNLVETYDPRERCAGIMHYPMTARRWTGIIEGRSDSKEAWNRVKIHA